MVDSSERSISQGGGAKKISRRDFIRAAGGVLLGAGGLALIAGQYGKTFGLSTTVEESVKDNEGVLTNQLIKLKLNDGEAVAIDLGLLKKTVDLLQEYGLDKGQFQVVVEVRSVGDPLFLEANHFGERSKAFAVNNKVGCTLVLSNQQLSDEIVLEEIGHLLDPNDNKLIGDEFPALAAEFDHVFFNRFYHSLWVTPTQAGEIDKHLHFSDFEADILSKWMTDIGNEVWGDFVSGVVQADNALGVTVSENTYYLDKDQLDLILIKLPSDSPQRQVIEWVFADGRDYLVRQYWGMYLTREYFRDSKDFVVRFPDASNNFAYMMDYAYREYRQEGFAKMFVRMYTNPAEAERIYPKEATDALKHLEKQLKIGNN